MVFIYLFILSGLGIATLLVAKRIEEKKRRKLFILELICRGDVMLREFHHEAINFYSEGKETVAFFVKKQLPMKSRSTLNKVLALIEDRTEGYLNNLRDSRLLKKSDGISEFFKNVSDVEKGGGEINEDYYEETSEVAIEEVLVSEKAVEENALLPVEVADPEVKTEQYDEPQNIEVKFEIVEPTAITEEEKPKKTRARKSTNSLGAPRKRKIKVVESLEL